MLEDGRARVNRRIRCRLIQTFQIREPDQFVFDDGAAERETSLQTAEERIRIVRYAIQCGVRGHVIVTIKRERTAVILVPARARNNVDCAHGRDARSQIEIEAGNLKFLHRIHREVLRCAARDGINDITAVYGQARQI